MKACYLIALISLSVSIYPTNLQAAYVWAWGSNYYGQTNVPPGLTNVVGIACGTDYGLALNSDGTVSAWGNNKYGACNVPTGLGSVVAISANGENNLALKADGTVVAWGTWDSYWQPNFGGGDVVGVAQALQYSLVLRADRTVTAWPARISTPQYGDVTVVPADLTNVIAIAGGIFQSLALQSDGTVTAFPEIFGAAPPGLTNITAVSAGWDHYLALRADGTVVAWGANGSGQTNVPPDLTNAVAIAAGFEVSLALKGDGTIVSWGNRQIVPQPQGLYGVEAISADPGEGQFAMALINTNTSKLPANISFVAPQTQTIGSGSQAFMSVSAVGSPPLTYQWYFFGTNALPGATNRWLSLSNTHPSQSGFYSVVVSNAQGSAMSQPVNLTVVPSLDIATAPAINLKGEPGWQYRIDYIDKMAVTNDWTVLATVTLTNQQQYYVDLSAIGQPARLYRLVQLP